MGAGQVVAVDLDDEKLKLAKEVGATGVINPKKEDFERKVAELTEDRGFDLAVELIGLAATVRQALQNTAPGGRTVIVGICPEEIALSPYHDLLLKERTLMGSADQR